jgi:hypothetical protein
LEFDTRCLMLDTRYSMFDIGCMVCHFDESRLNRDEEKSLLLVNDKISRLSNKVGVPRNDNNDYHTSNIQNQMSNHY